MGAPALWRPLYKPGVKSWLSPGGKGREWGEGTEKDRRPTPDRGFGGMRIPRLSTPLNHTGWCCTAGCAPPEHGRPLAAGCPGGVRKPLRETGDPQPTFQEDLEISEGQILGRQATFRVQKPPRAKGEAGLESSWRPHLICATNLAPSHLGAQPPGSQHLEVGEVTSPPRLHCPKVDQRAFATPEGEQQPGRERGQPPGAPLKGNSLQAASRRQARFIYSPQRMLEDKRNIWTSELIYIFGRATFPFF